MNDPKNANAQVEALFRGTMPEREAEIASLLARVDYQIASDRPAMHLEATAFFGQGLVVYTERTMQQIWLITCLSWRTLHEQSGFVLVSLIQKTRYDLEKLGVDTRNDEFVALVDRLSFALAELRTAEEDQDPWPTDVPHITPDLSELRDKQDKAAYDLACFACAFVVLHETRHALKRIAGEPESGIAEEMECDQFATEWLLGSCNSFAESSGEDPLGVRRKRAMGVFVGLAVIFESTEKGLWQPSETHPAIHDRIARVIDAVRPLIPDPDDSFWVFATCVLLSKLRRSDRLPTDVPFDSCRALFEEALARFKPE